MTSEITLNQAEQAGRYRLGPFCLLSELPLPQLTPAGTGLLEVKVCLGRAGAAPAETVELSKFLSAGPRSVWLDLPGTARYLIRNGSEVTVEVYPGAHAGDVQGYLTAWVFGALCHQRGLLPLHASAVRRAGGVTAFVADSGAGKSTLAAALERRGLTIVADDICLLDVPLGGGDGAQPAMPRVLPVAPWLKLDRPAAAMLGRHFAESDRTFSDEDKYRIPLGQTALPDSMPLSHLIFMVREPAAAAATLTPLRGAAALGRLLDKIYIGHIAEALNMEQRLFEQCAAVLKQADAHLLTVPPGLDRVGETLDLLDPLLDD